ncbi:MAG: STAS domain-containing protein [Candidatus Omnitrophota bacterium]|nr:STAS domain-containing protein [Candidatus Omnitrophota bacterium]
MSLKVNVEQQKEGTYVIRVDGRLDTETYVGFGEKIKQYLDESTKILIFDLEKLDYISSIGIGVIFQARKAIEARKGVFIVTNLQPQIKKIFEVVKALPEKPVFESMEEVDEYLDLIQKNELEKGIQ